MLTYKEKLLDPKWQRKRLEILQRDSFTCQRCKTEEKTLHVHHKAYTYLENPWDYDPLTLITLCDDCHKYETDNKLDTIDDLVVSLKMWLLTDEIKKIKQNILKKVRKQRNAK